MIFPRNLKRPIFSFGTPQKKKLEISISARCDFWCRHYQLIRSGLYPSRINPSEQYILEDTKKVAFHVKSDSTVGQGKSTDGRERFRWSAVEEGVST